MYILNRTHIIFIALKKKKIVTHAALEQYQKTEKSMQISNILYWTL